MPGMEQRVSPTTHCSPLSLCILISVPGWLPTGEQASYNTTTATWEKSKLTTVGWWRFYFPFFTFSLLSFRHLGNLSHPSCCASRWREREKAENEGEGTLPSHNYFPLPWVYSSLTSVVSLLLGKEQDDCEEIKRRQVQQCWAEKTLYDQSILVIKVVVMYLMFVLLHVCVWRSVTQYSCGPFGYGNCDVSFSTVLKETPFPSI